MDITWTVEIWIHISGDLWWLDMKSINKYNIINNINSTVLVIKKSTMLCENRNKESALPMCKTMVESDCMWSISDWWG